ncbi:MAG: hypothetical protein WB679_13525 [Terracidiphilus sp.]
MPQPSSKRIVAFSRIKIYMPSGQIGLTDPDGYAVSVCHWGREQQSDWEKHLSQRARVRE